MPKPDGGFCGGCGSKMELIEDESYFDNDTGEKKFIYWKLCPKRPRHWLAVHLPDFFGGGHDFEKTDSDGNYVSPYLMGSSSNGAI